MGKLRKKISQGIEETNWQVL